MPDAAAAEDDVVLRDTPAAGVARLRINRPAKRNAIDHAVRERMTVLLREALADRSCRALVIGGTERMFSAGGDVPSMGGLDAAGARARMRHIHVLCRLVAEAPIPVVSAVEGIGAGGAIGLALLGDRIVVGDGSRILFPFLGLGLAPDWGQLLTLPRRVGLGAARRLVASTAPVLGPDALAIGLADECVADDAVMETAVERARTLGALPQDAFARTKRRLAEPSADLAQELAREEDDQATLLRGPEFAEGFAAFGEKRRADFSAIQRPAP